ncbi:MAG: hypothetical protein BGO98_28895 [Myxococcales bacterium 68-20]|nr:MAG: hypothetical protein BGO98_28895 [Myxococcales bacterium 68-20]
MPYREPAGELARRDAAVVEKGPILRLDASGRRGSNGVDGQNGRDGVGAGADGGHGEDASPAVPGEPAGQIALDLRSLAGSETSALLSIELRSAAAGHRRNDTEIDFARPGDIELIAVGGHGGNGGNGGRGGSGARGRSGADATRWSSGEDGGPGGDGGDGGNGSSGAPGGRGGDVVLRVSEEDAPLLLLVRNDVRGGEGGSEGVNGWGGAGGPGGSGGSSYSWTETESYRDSNGNSQTRTRSHSKPGGSSGRSGSDGRAARAEPRAGANGAPGTVTIELRDDAGRTTSYRSRYDVRLVSFEHRNANDDGIYEPEEKVFVSRVTVQNSGGMPLPRHHDIVVRVADDGWIAPADEQKLVLPRALAPGETHVFERDELELALRMFRPQRSGAPLAAPETIHLLAELPRVRRRFGGFETPDAPHGNIVIRFPIEVSEPTALFSLAPGQATRIRWQLTNVSGKPFGLASEQGRAVGVRLVLDGGEIGADRIHLLAPSSPEEKHVSLEHGLDLDVPRVGAGEDISFEATIAVPSDAAPYTSARFVVSAELGHIAEPRRARAVHLQEIRISVGRPFDARGADVLLVVNNRTMADEVAAWEELVRSSGLTVSVWDAALEGGLAVLRNVAAGAHDYRLVVVLNNAFDTPIGERLPSTLVDKATSMALARRGTHVLYVGRKPNVATLLVPTDGEAPELAQTSAQDEAVLAACANDAIGEPVARFQARAWFSWPWSEPKEEHLAKRARALSALLARTYPDRRYVVVHDFAPEVERRVAWLRRITLGWIEVRRSLDVARGAIASIEADPAVMHEPSFAHAEVTYAVALRALPLPAKLQLLDSGLGYGTRTPDVTDGCSDAVVAAVLGDLVREQEAARDDGWRRADLDEALPLLMTLERAGFAMPIGRDDGGPRAARFIELVAWLDLVARDHPRFWEWLPPLSLLRRRPQLRRVVRASLARLVARVMGDDEKAIWRAIATRREELRQAIRRRRKKLELASSCALAFTRDRVETLVSSRVIQSDAASLPRRERVIDKRRHDELRAKDLARSERAAGVATSAANARASLLREETCEELLARTLPRTRVAVTTPFMNVAPAGSEEAAVLERSAASLAELREQRRP